MNTILNNLSLNEVLYTTSKGTDYLFKGTSKNSGIIYCINNNKKYLSKIVIEKAIEDYTNGIEIDRLWYKKTFSKQYKNSPCNLFIIRYVLKKNR